MLERIRANTLSQYYTDISWGEQIPVPAWDKIDTYKTLLAAAPAATSRRMGIVWQKMSDCDKLDFILANIHQEANQEVSKEYVACVVAKCWKQSKHLSKGSEILMIREHCLQLNTPNLAVKKNKKLRLGSHNEFEINAGFLLPSYYKKALIADSPQFQQFFSKLAAGKSHFCMDNFYPQMRELIEIHFGKKSPSTNFEDAAKFLFLAGAWGLKCETYNQLFIDQIRTLPVNNRNMKMFLQLVVNNNVVLPPRVVIPFFDYLIRCNEEAPRGPDTYYTLSSIGDIIEPLVSYALCKWAEHDWQVSIPNPAAEEIAFISPNDPQVKNWDALSEYNKILTTINQLSRLSTKMQSIITWIGQAALKKILKQCWSKISQLKCPKQMGELRERCLNLPGANFEDKKIDALKIACHADINLLLPKYFRKPLIVHFGSPSAFEAEIKNMPLHSLVDLIKQLNIPLVRFEKQLVNALNHQLMSTFFSEEIVDAKTKFFERIDDFLYRHAATLTFELNTIIVMMTPYLSVKSDGVKQELFVILSSIYALLMQESSIQDNQKEELKQLCLQLIGQMNLQALSLDDKNKNFSNVISEILHLCPSLEVLHLHKSTIESYPSLLSSLHALPKLAHLYFSNGFDDLQAIVDLGYKPMHAASGNDDSDKVGLGVCFIRFDVHEDLMNEISTQTPIVHSSKYFRRAISSQVIKNCENQLASFTFYFQGPH